MKSLNDGNGPTVSDAVTAHDAGVGVGVGLGVGVGVGVAEVGLVGVGLSFHVVPEIADELAEGRLLRVLPRWSTPTLSVDALMPPRTTQPAKVRTAIEALRSYLNTLSKRVSGS